MSLGENTILLNDGHKMPLLGLEYTKQMPEQKWNKPFKTPSALVIV